jgi:hypothetical protein
LSGRRDIQNAPKEAETCAAEPGPSRTENQAYVTGKDPLSFLRPRE